MKLIRKQFAVESAWENGPLRKVGSGDGKPTKYVCGACKQIVVGVYLSESFQGQNSGLGPSTNWICAGCRS